jgi:hypothetical protein
MRTWTSRTCERTRSCTTTTTSSPAADGSLSFDFGEIDAIYDQLLGIGLRPIVELSCHACGDS